MAYVTSTAFKLYRGISTTSEDALLTVLLANAQAAVERYCDRVFEASSTAARTYDAVEDVEGRTLYLDADLCDIESIVNGDGTTLGTTSYITRPVNDTPYYEIRMRSGSDNAWEYEDEHEDAITVTGKWAYSESAPADIQQATLRLANYMYAQKDTGSAEVTAYPEAGLLTLPAGWPKDVVELLRPYRRLR